MNSIYVHIHSATARKPSFSSQQAKRVTEDRAWLTTQPTTGSPRCKSPTETAHRATSRGIQAQIQYATEVCAYWRAHCGPSSHTTQHSLALTCESPIVVRKVCCPVYRVTLHASHSANE